MAPPPRAARAEMPEVILHGLASRHRHVHLHLVADLSVSPGRGALRRALDAAIEAFPVLGCRYVAGATRDRWVRWEGDAEDLLHTEATPDVEAATRRRVTGELPHHERPPWGVARLEHVDGSRLVVSAHHMLVDGGGLKALAHVIAASLAGVAPAPPTSPRRSLLLPARALRLRDLPALAAELAREAAQPLAMLRVRPIGGAPDADGAPAPGWIPVGLAGEEATAFAESLGRRGATINDGLVAAVAAMGARRADRGPVVTGYTVDLRRFLRRPRLLATNLHGVCLAVLRRRDLESVASTVEAVTRQIGAQKRRLHGLAYALLPSLAFGWLPHGLLRLAGRALIGNLLSYLNRGLVITNIGPLDEALAPLGNDLRAASVVGPFIHGLPVPVLTATGLGGELTVQVCFTGTVPEGAAREHARQLRGELSEIASADGA